MVHGQDERGWGEIFMREEGKRERERGGLDFEGFWKRRVKDEGG